MKFLIVGDLHGNKPNLHFKDYDAVIAPGDFCSSEARKYMFEALQHNLKYPKAKKLNWYDICGKVEANRIIKKSIKDGRQILEYLNSLNVPVYVVPGNNDWTPDEEADWPLLHKDHYSELIKDLQNIIDVHHKLVDINGCQIIGHGITSGPELPQYKEDKQNKTSEELDKIARQYEADSAKLSSLFRKAKKPVIFLSHNVPFNTPIDRITNEESPRYGYHYGSLIAREMINKYEPVVCIGGHMHEHHTFCTLGKTTAINTGFGSDANTFIEILGNEIKTLKFRKAEN